MACGPKRAPGRCDVPPSNGAPMIMMSVPAQERGSARSARSTPRNVASGPYMPPSLVIGSPYADAAWPGQARSRRSQTETAASGCVGLGRPETEAARRKRLPRPPATPACDVRIVHRAAGSTKHDVNVGVRVCLIRRLRTDGARVSRSTQNSLDPQAIQELVLADGRRLELEGVFNFRDVGGYPAAGGRTTRWRTLLRSDALHRLDPAGSAVLAGLGLRTVLDLRTQAEAEIAP